ncbi:MAG: glycosyltransferase family 4 protein [Gammaproteobacteria bacterium]
MKILYLCSDLGIPVLGRKGASVHVRELVGALVRSGHSTVVAGPVLQKSPWDQPADIDGSILHVPLAECSDNTALCLKSFNEMIGVDNTLSGEIRRITYNDELFRRLKRRFESDPPDFIYERAALYGTAGVQLAQTFNVPLLLELNSPLAVEQSTYRRTAFGELAAIAEQWALSRADAILTVSEPLRQHVLEQGLESSRVHVLPNGVNASLFRPEPRDTESRTRWELGDDLVLGFVGGLRPWHGVDILPLLLEQLIGRYPALRLVFVGEGPLRSRLESDLREKGLHHHAVFTGALSHAEVPPLIRQFDVALAPYPEFDHPFYFSPLKLFEYMGCGIPVVAAAAGQITQIVRHEETGLLYSPGDLAALTEYCDRLLGNPEEREILGRAAAKEIHARYTWDHNAERVVEIARKLIKRRT